MALLIDLDNTLVDRDRSFRLWVEHAVPSWGGDSGDIEWLVDADRSGYTPRLQLAQLIEQRLRPGSVEDILERLRFEHVAAIECYPGVLDQLAALASDGVPLIIITNGDSKQQRMKLARTGLDRIVTDAVISGEVGVKKPDQRIFDAARAVVPDEKSFWVMGDHVDADIAGGRAAGCSTAWVSHERPWPKQWAPDLSASQPGELLALLRQELANRSTYDASV